MQEEREQDRRYVDEDSSERVQILMDWMRENGAVFSKVKVRLYSATQQYLHASRDIKKGEVILSVPHELVIASKKLGETAIGEAIQKITLNHALSGFVGNLLVERSDPATKFEPVFINIKPKGLPLTYSMEQLSWIAGSPLYETIIKLKLILQDDFAKLKQAIPDMAPQTFEGFLDLFSVINSRCFKSEDSDCIIPLLDKICFDHQVSNSRPLFTKDGF